LLIPVKRIPTRERRKLLPVPRDRGRLVLAYGEVTGHSHVVEGEAELLFRAADVEELERRFLHVEAESMLVHEEHDTITLPPGDFEVVRQREYAPEAPRFVAD
jgi:hypothetical protein